MTKRIIRIATRKSPLALWQANHVRQLLLQHWPDRVFELVPLVTSGDQFLKDTLQAVGGKGLFVKELEEAMLDKRACLAVHSSKDMPVDFPPGLFLAAVCTRDNPFDAFVSNQYATIDALPPKAIVGTASLRRQSQLLAYRPDLDIQSLRGNVNTRLAKLDSGDYQAIILAAAGLERLGFEDRITQILPQDIMLPSCGQGTLCIESRVDDMEIQELVSPLNDPLSALCLKTERQVNAQLGGNCHTPLAVFSQVLEQKFILKAKLSTPDGRLCIEDYQQGPLSAALSLASQCATALLNKGAAKLLEHGS